MQKTTIIIRTKDGTIVDTCTLVPESTEAEAEIVAAIYSEASDKKLRVVIRIPSETLKELLANVKDW